jgi:hypothetical protein
VNCAALRLSIQDGKIPWREGFKERLTALRRGALTAFDNPEQRSAIERCLSSNGAPPMQPNLDGNLYQFVQTPATTVIVSEFVHDARIVRMNGTHSPAAITSWLGDSIGWWEKDTLVVKTKYFSPNSGIRLNARHLFFVSPETIVIENAGTVGTRKCTAALRRRRARRLRRLPNDRESVFRLDRCRAFRRTTHLPAGQSRVRHVEAGYTVRQVDQPLPRVAGGPGIGAAFHRYFSRYAVPKHDLSRPHSRQRLA